MSLVATYFLIELVPVYLVMDTSFMSVLSNERNLDLSHSSTQPLFEKEHFYNPNVAGALSSPSLGQLEFRSRNLTNNNLESVDSSRVLTFDALNLREGISLLQTGERMQATGDRSTFVSQMTTNEENIVSLGSVFQSESEFNLYE